MLSKFFLFVIIPFCVPSWADSLAVKDDIGSWVRLNRPAKRIISLSPHSTELIFALGAGEQIVGVDSASDYPIAAQKIVPISDFQNVQLDKLLFLKPDLVIFWQNQILEKKRFLLQSQGIAVFISRPQSFTDIASNIERLGVLIGKVETGRQQAQALLKEVEQLRQKYQYSSPLSIYLQIADRPMLSVSKQSFIGKMLALCNGNNIFAASAVLTPLVSQEAVLAANPDVIFYLDQPQIVLWRQYPWLKAVKKKAIIALPSALISRPGPRLIEGQRLICHAIDRLRKSN